MCRCADFSLCRLVRAVGRLVVRFGAFHGGFCLFRTALGCRGDLVGSFLALGGNFVCHFLALGANFVPDFLRRHGNLFCAFLRRGRDYFGVMFDRLADHLGIVRYRCGNAVGRIRGIRVECQRQQHAPTDQGRVNIDSHMPVSSGEQNTPPYFSLRAVFCTLPVPPTGTDSTNITSSGMHNRAICFARNSRISSRSRVRPGLRTTKSRGLSCHFGCFTPMTAAAATAGWAMATFSRSIELIHSPPVLIRSLTRSLICMTPWASMVAMSPVGNQPAASGEESHL